MRGMKLSLAAGFVLAAGEALAFTLFEGGAAARAVIPDAPEESTKLAAAEWTNYVFKATGAAPALEAIGACTDLRGAVIIGTLTSLGDRVPAAFRKMFDGEESHDAFVTGFADGAWWIVGREEVAELYGVYRTLEQQLGVRWFKPWQKDDPGEYVPRSAKVELPDAPRKQSPWFLQRHIDMTGSSVAYIPRSGMAWVYRAGLQTAALAANEDAVVRKRLADDRRWLKEFWIDASDALRAKMARALGARRTGCGRPGRNGRKGRRQGVGERIVDGRLLRPLGPCTPEGVGRA